MWCFHPGELRDLTKNMRTIICMGNVLQCQHEKLTSASPGSSILESCPGFSVMVILSCFYGMVCLRREHLVRDALQADKSILGMTPTGSVRDR